MTVKKAGMCTAAFAAMVLVAFAQGCSSNEPAEESSPTAPKGAAAGTVGGGAGQTATAQPQAPAAPNQAP